MHLTVFYTQTVIQARTTHTVHVVRISMDNNNNNTSNNMDMDILYV